MSRIIAARPAHAAPRRPQAPASLLLRVRRIGYVVLALQLACFLAWSTLLYHRFALTFDFAVYHQAWFAIAHGNLDPYSSIEHLQFWREDSEFAPWPLAPVYWIWPHDVLLLWIQDIGVVGAEALAFSWLCELAAALARTGPRPGWPVPACSCWSPTHGSGGRSPTTSTKKPCRSRSSCSWPGILPAGGGGRGPGWCRSWPPAAPSATYLAGVGLGGVLASRRARVLGVLLLLVGIGYSLLVQFDGGDQAATLGKHFGYLATGSLGTVSNHVHLSGLVTGIAGHPLRVIHTLWAKRADMLANLAPAGFLGLGSPLLLPLILVSLLTDTLSLGLRFAEPIFQALPIYVLMPVGTVTVLSWLARRRRRTALLLAGLVAAQTLGWAAVWGPLTPSQWLKVPAPAAATLAAVAARIPASAEVIASQGVVGGFSGRSQLHEVTGPGPRPITSNDTWFIITPQVGVELQSTASAIAFIAELAGPLHAALVTHAHGVWAFRWRPPPQVTRISVPDGAAPIPAWTSPGAAGRDVLTGPVAGWHVTSAGARGYVCAGLSWQEPPGRYQASVTLSATGPVNVEIWNNSGNVLLARRSLPGTSGVESVSLAVNAMTAYQARLYSGWGPFRADFVPPPAGQQLEVRVWSPGGQTVNVYRAGLTRAAGAGPPRQRA